MSWDRILKYEYGPSYFPHSGERVFRNIRWTMSRVWIVTLAVYAANNGDSSPLLFAENLCAFDTLEKAKDWLTRESDGWKSRENVKSVDFGDLSFVVFRFDESRVYSVKCLLIR